MTSAPTEPSDGFRIAGAKTFITNAPEADLLRALRATTGALKFTGLAVLHAAEDGDRGEVTFLARVYEKGQDRSFVERSDFRRVDGAWRYVGALDEPRPPTDAERARLR